MDAARKQPEIAEIRSDDSQASLNSRGCPEVGGI